MAPTNDPAGATAPSPPYEDASVTFIQDQVIAPSSTQNEALSKVYQAVSQSVSLTVQDATDNLRNFSTVNLAALSYAQEKYVATQDPTWIPIITQLQTVLTTQIQTFAKIGKDASTVLQTFLNPQTQPNPSTSTLQAQVVATPSSENYDPPITPPPSKPSFFKRVLSLLNKNTANQELKE